MVSGVTVILIFSVTRLEAAEALNEQTIHTRLTERQWTTSSEHKPHFCLQA